MKFSSDVDLDFPTDFRPEDLFPWTRASLVKNDELAPHPCGVYPQAIPVDQLTNLAAIPYKQAEEIGYVKVDFLHVSLYDHFKSREEIEELLEIEPDWEILQVPAHQKKLFQLSNHGDVLTAIRPKCVEELADVLALIRPGKKQLINLYKVNKEATRRILYARDENGYQFKRSHSTAYSLVIKLQLHLISAGIL